ncbi:MAG TPA: apolipoprotein N-acyltransferase [Candidatus Paceibacterota bacterium]
MLNVIFKTTIKLLSESKNQYVWLFIFVHPFLLFVSFWVDSLWFLIGVAFIPLFFFADVLPRNKTLLAIFISVLTDVAVLGYPLINLRSVQLIIPDFDQYTIVVGTIVGYAGLLALLWTLAIWIPLTFFRGLWARVIAVPSAWLIFEYVKMKFSFDLNWIFMGEPLIEFPPLAVFSRWGGPFVLSFLVLGFNVAAYEGIRTLFIGRERGRRWLPLAKTFVVLAFLIAFGWTYLKFDAERGREDDTREAKTITVAIVQPGSLYDQERQDAYFDKLRVSTREIVTPENTSVDVLVFPGNFFEGITAEDLRDRDLARELLGFKPNAGAVLLGFPFWRDEKRYQTSALFSRSGGAQLSSKERLLPIADFIPPLLSSIYPILDILSSNYMPGEHQLLALLNKEILIGVISCSEEFIPAFSRRLKREGASFLIVSGSVDDFKSAAVYKEALRAARFRAMENNIFVVQAMKSGISAIIDPRGRVLKYLPPGERGVLTGEVRI